MDKPTKAQPDGPWPTDPQPETRNPSRPQSVAMDLLEAAWGLIANAGGGDWTRENAPWQEAAVRWRDRYHELLGVNRIQRSTYSRFTRLWHWFAHRLGRNAGVVEVSLGPTKAFVGFRCRACGRLDPIKPGARVSAIVGSRAKN